MRLGSRITVAAFTAAASLGPVAAADPRGPMPVGGPSTGFLATCEDLGRFCFADACGRDQIEAAQGCRARCPSAAVMSVVPAACPVLDAMPGPVLRRRG